MCSICTPRRTTPSVPWWASMSARCSWLPRSARRCRPSPGRAQRYDYEYERKGVGNVFTTVEPLAGWRHVEVNERRTAIDFAQQMRWLVDEAYPNAEVIRVVLDNLNTHSPASLYAAFPAPDARRLARKLEFHHTPKHGSWLNVAECELAVLAT